MDGEADERRYRSVFISDVHLGARECQAELLLDFIREIRCERLYLVGDIVDGWRLRKAWWWPQAHNDVVQKILRLARKGVAVTYIPGNHDEVARPFCGARFGAIVVVREAVHITADGRRLLVTHGDDFDDVVRYAGWRAALGSAAYRTLLALNTQTNRARRRLGRDYWSLAAFLKGRVGNARRYVARYEQALAEEARRRGLDGVVCGHIHQPALRRIGEALYANDGDWVESCTALVEHFDGRLEILEWAKMRSWSMISRARASAEGDL